MPITRQQIHKIVFDDVMHVLEGGAPGISQTSRQSIAMQAAVRVSRHLEASGPPADQPARWRHKKRASTYVEVGRPKFQVTDVHSLADMQPMVVYRSEKDGSLWVRPEDEFEDGRFERLDDSAAATQKARADALKIAVRSAMQDAWNTICADTNCHPLDIKHEARKLFFDPAHWADLTATLLVSSFDAPTSPPAPTERGKL